MLRLVVLAKTEGDANVAASWATGGEKGPMGFEKNYQISGFTAKVQASVCYLDMAASKPVGTSIIMLCKNAGDLQAIDQLVQHYKKVPIKFVLYDGAPEDTSFENQYAAKGIVRDNPEKLVAEIIKESNDIVKLIANVFKQFDTDKSGYIELKEIKQLANELGVQIPEAEAEIIMKTLDINGDGKISMEEFVEWWKAGREGKTSTMSEIIVGMVKKNKLYTSASEVLSSIPGLTEELKEADLKLVKSAFGIFVNRPKNTGVLLELSAMTRGKMLDQEFQMFSSAVGLTPKEPFFGLALGCKNPKSAGETFKNIIETVYSMASGMIPNSEQYFSMIDKKFGEVGNKVVMCITPSQSVKPMIEGIFEMIKPFTGIIFPEQLFQLYFGLGTDLKKIATESKPIYEFLSEGASFEMKAQISAMLHDRIIQILREPKIKEAMSNKVRKLVGTTAGSAMWINGVKGELEFEIDQELKEIIAEQGSQTPLAIPIKDLKAMQAPMFKEAISQIPIAEMAHNFFKEEVTSIEFFVYGGGLAGLKFSLDLPGLGDLISFE